ncbi:MAG: hypothetical protein KDK37_03980, partial [Leptospiraceae bacterium]|nr:hypothetical protein [Leptospiraceae bacterium]
MGRFRFGRNDAAYACILFFTGFLALPFSASLAEPVFHHGDESISLAPVVDTTKKAVEADNTWWVTDETLDPASARSMQSCKDAFPDVRFFAETKPFENTGKTVAGASKEPIVWFCREFKVEGKPLGAYAVELAQIDDRDRTYLNGALIGATGDFDAELAQAYDWARIYPVGDSQIREGSNLLLVQVRGYSLATKWGMFVDRTRFGTASSIYSRFYAFNFMAAGFLIMYFTAASYFLFLFLRRQKEREYLFFAIFTFLLVIYQFFRTQLKYEISEDFLLWKRMEYIVLFLLVPSFYYFFRAYFHMPSSRWQKLLDYGML